jgi:mannose-6-phosphate isomerase-like protein (cupin superfamily)
MQHHPIAELVARAAAGPESWYEFVVGPRLTVGVYVLPAGADDHQSPHVEDEVYVVVAGRSKFSAAGVTVDVAPGDTIHVPAGVSHRYHDIVEDLHIVYTLTPAEVPAD